MIAHNAPHNVISASGYSGEKVFLCDETKSVSGYSEECSSDEVSSEESSAVTDDCGDDDRLLLGDAGDDSDDNRLALGDADGDRDDSDDNRLALDDADGDRSCDNVPGKLLQ